MANQYGGGLKLVNLLVVLVLYLNSSHAQSNTTTNPLEEPDVLKTYRLGNHLQCERLCWYRNLCARFSFYTKRDNPGGNTDNCVLHAFNGSEPQQGPLLEGWTSALASGDSLSPGHPCKPRPCRELQVCVPVKNYTNHTCIMAPETDMNNCASSPCVNGGTCQDLINGYNCTCLPGFSGNDCQTDLYWLNDACTANSECTFDPKAVCNGGRCVCDGATGFFFSHSHNQCVAVCSQYHPSEYTRYVLSGFAQHDTWNQGPTTVDNCKTRCSNDPACKQFVWMPTLTCWAKSVTAQDFPSAWKSTGTNEVYQKTCM